MSAASRLLVAAMDIGTTYSGYAFSFRDKPDDIQANPSWVAGSEKLISLKNPTCVLLKPNKEFHSFGFEAENKYMDLAEDDEHDGWFLFRRFKMSLYETKNLTLDITVEDITGKKMSAMTIFAHTIRFLKDHLYKTLTSRATGIERDDIEYVITVPAIWDEMAKQFMKKAANEAGIESNQLKIALEPEAASVWCQVVTDHTLTRLSESGSKYMVVDLGGGTADITVHEKLYDGTLKERHTASGGAWGGNEVDKAYIAMLTEIVGAMNMERFRQKHTGDYFDIHRDFETKKRTITNDGERKITFKIPAALKEIAEKDDIPLKTKIDNSRYKGQVFFSGDKLRVPQEKAAKLFQDPISSLVKHVEELFKQTQLRDVGTVLLVGGYGECELVKDAFTKSFPNKSLIIPSEAGLAVLKGAVRFGHLPAIVSTRCSRFTFGREKWVPFDASIHESGRKETLNETQYCKGIFAKFVDKGEEMPIGKKVKISGDAIYLDQKEAAINIFSSTDQNPEYVDETHCKRIGTLVVQFPEFKTLSESHLDIEIEFGNTTIKITCFVPKSGQRFQTELSCFV